GKSLRLSCCAHAGAASFFGARDETRPETEETMKPTHTVLLALVCAFAAAGTAWLLFDSTHPAQPQVAVAADAAAERERIAQLESQVSELNEKLDQLLRLKAEPRPEPETRQTESSKPQ